MCTNVTHDDIVFATECRVFRQGITGTVRYSGLGIDAIPGMPTVGITEKYRGIVEKYGRCKKSFIKEHDGCLPAKMNGDRRRIAPAGDFSGKINISLLSRRA
jgi:hypothetical protein